MHLWAPLETTLEIVDLRFGQGEIFAPAKHRGVSGRRDCRLIETGFDSLLVRSFAPGATAEDLNLVLWRWSDKAPTRLVLIDDENRLSR